MNRMEDKELVSLLKADPNKGFSLFMEKYREAVYWHIRRLVVSYDDAKDVAQETFVRIFRNIHQYKAGNSFAAWVYRIATNESLRFLNKRKEEGEPLENAFMARADHYIDYADLEAVKLQRAIHALPPKQQATFNMRYFDEMGFEEIAHATGSTPSAAKMNYKLAKDKITKYLKDYE